MNRMPSLVQAACQPFIASPNMLTLSLLSTNRPSEPGGAIAPRTKQLARFRVQFARCFLDAGAIVRYFLAICHSRSDFYHSRGEEFGV